MLSINFGSTPLTDAANSLVLSELAKFGARSCLVLWCSETMNDQEINHYIPFNEKFCSHLEYHLGQTFEISDRQDLSGFWCDGISWSPTPDNQLTKKSVKDTRQIVTTAWIGKDGQDEYEMTIRFGQSALSRYSKGAEMVDCIPGSGSVDWINIEPENKRIEIRLK